MGYLGVDNGANGACFHIRDDGSHGMFCFSPTHPRRVCSFIDIIPFLSWLGEQGINEHTSVLLEEPALNQGKHTNAWSIASTAASFACIVSALRMVGVVDLTTAPAISWQSLLWKVGGSGKQSVAMAQGIFGISFVRAGCRVPDNDLTDAAMLAHVRRDPDLFGLLVQRADKRARAKSSKAARRKVTLAAMRKSLEDGGI